MLWLKIVGILALFGSIHHLLITRLDEPHANRHRNHTLRLVLGGVGSMLLWFCILAVFSFWILWLTGNPI